MDECGVVIHHSALVGCADGPLCDHGLIAYDVFTKARATIRLSSYMKNRGDSFRMRNGVRDGDGVVVKINKGKGILLQWI